MQVISGAPGRIALAVHGGAGQRRAPIPRERQAAYDAGLRRALAAGRAVLAAGGPALDAVCASVVELEDDELFNAGRGAALTAGGTAELDAAVMTGDGAAGAVAACRSARNPVLAAQAVMERTPHVLLAAPAAEQLAEWGIAQEPADYFVTAHRQQELHTGQAMAHGTVGAVARDADGRLAAATSTGGTTGQLVGRIGDSPIIGAGTYAAGDTVAVSCTGQGEFFLRGVVAFDVSARMRYGGEDVESAVRATFATSLQARGGWGGLIAVDRDGRTVLAFNSDGMFCGYLDGDELRTRI